MSLKNSYLVETEIEIKNQLFIRLKSLGLHLKTFDFYFCNKINKNTWSLITLGHQSGFELVDMSSNWRCSIY